MFSNDRRLNIPCEYLVEGLANISVLLFVINSDMPITCLTRFFGCAFMLSVESIRPTKEPNAPGDHKASSPLVWLYLSRLTITKCGLSHIATYTSAWLLTPSVSQIVRPEKSEPSGRELLWNKVYCKALCDGSNLFRKMLSIRWRDIIIRSHIKAKVVARFCEGIKISC